MPYRVKHRKLAISGSVILLLLLGVAGQTANLVRWYHRQHGGQPMQWGVSFSAPYAASLGVDPHQALTALTHDLGVRHLRLMSYWDVLEPQPGRYDFSELDWELAQVKESGADVSLAIGQRQPRWPECHLPVWASKLGTQQEHVQLEEFLTTVVNRYKNHNEIIDWQLENEALNSFGQCPPPDRNELAAELALVHRLDPDRPVAMTASDEVGVPLGKPRPDEFGLSVYHEQYYHLWFFSGKFVYPSLSWWQTARAAITERFLHRPVFIHELQAEPWGPRPVTQMSDQEQNKYFSPHDLTQMAAYAKSTGIRRVYLWGGEWWYWRKAVRHDPSVWQAARKVLSL